MIHLLDSRGTVRRRFSKQACKIPAFIFFYAVFSSHGASSGPDCPKRLDSLIIAGSRCLDSNDVSGARRYFTMAYKCGMSKDSMCYFAAEIYLRSFAPDTALIFNWALEKAGRFKRELCMEQRARIFRFIGLKHEADSLFALIRKKDQHDAALIASASRSIMSLAPFTLMPINLTLRPDIDIDDIGREALRYKWSRYQDSWLKRTFVMLDVNTDLPVPTRYNFDEESDTLIRSFSFYVGAGNLPSTPECMLGHRIAVHTDNKIDHFDKLSCSFPIGKKRFLTAGQDIKWTSDEGIDDSRTELSLSQLSLTRKYTWFCALSLSHHFSKSDLYQNKLGSSGVYRLMPLGYTDFNPLDTSQPQWRYYRDPDLTVPFKSSMLDEYWAAQPGMRLVTLPEHDLNAALKSSVQIKLPLKMNLALFNFVQCIWYPKRMQWFSIDDSAKINYYRLYTEYAVVFNAADGKYYITTERTQLNYIKNSLVELKKHEKTRIDCYISMSVTLEKELGEIGKLYFSTTYVKGLSTLSGTDPIVGLNYCWELQAGWKKDIFYAK